MPAGGGFRVEECLTYFRRAVADPRGVTPWSEWWAANAGLVELAFPRSEFLRLKHRRLSGAQHILQAAGELPEDYCPENSMVTGSCNQCGERTVTHTGGPWGGSVTCPTCGVICTYHTRPATHAGGQSYTEPAATP